MQEIINPVGKAEREYGRGTTINSNHTIQSKEKRLRNVCQPPSKYASGKSKPGRCTDVKLPDGAGLMEESGNDFLYLNLVPLGISGLSK